MAETELVKQTAGTLTGMAVTFLKAVGVILAVIIVLLIIQSFAGVALDIVKDIVTFLLGLLP